MRALAFGLALVGCQGDKGPPDDLDPTTGGPTTPPCVPEAEVCNGLDDDCDGAVDVEDPDVSGAITGYPDADGDGAGDDAGGVLTCALGPLVALGGDCDDGDPSVHPGAAERCGGGDEDCDGLVDDEDAPVDLAQTWYADDDADGFGDDDRPSDACLAPAGHVGVAGDCDDTDDGVHPDADELCTPPDEDCDGLVGDDDPTLAGAPTWYLDADGDGAGSVDGALSACERPPGYVANAGDCDDGSPIVRPGGVEVCGGADEDCDGLVDDDDPDDPGVLVYADADGDGWGDDATALVTCTPDPGSVPVGGDCADGDPDTFPGAIDACGDGVDQDCSGADPVCPFGPDATILEPPPGDALAGWDVAFAPDADGDGDDELVVSAPVAESDRGAVYVLGDALGALDLTSGVALIGEVTYDNVGDCVAGSRDLDGDGSPDVVASSEDVGVYEGRVYVVPASSTGGATILAASTAWVDGPATSASLGCGLLAADADGDGLDDLVVGASMVDATFSGEEGAVYVLRGPLSGATSAGDAVTTLHGEPSTWLGEGDEHLAVADLDGDGLPGLVVGAPSALGFLGEVYLLGTVPAGVVTVSTVADARLQGTSLLDGLGHDVAVIEDQDGDGVAEVALRGPDAASGGDTVVLVPADTVGTTTVDAAATVRFEGPNAPDTGAFGASFASLGDLDGDGAIELAVAASSWDQAAEDAGGVFVFHGPFAGVIGDEQAAIVVTGLEDDLGGWSLAAGHVDGDGLLDLAVGAPATWTNRDGYVALLPGSSL